MRDFTGLNESMKTNRRCQHPLNTSRELRSAINASSFLSAAVAYRLR